MTPVAEHSLLTYPNYYKDLVVGVYNSTTISTVFWKTLTNSLKYYGIPLAAKVLIVLAAVAIATTPPLWIVAAITVESLVFSHLETRAFVWATKSWAKLSWTGWLNLDSWKGWIHNTSAENIRNIDHEFKIVVNLISRVASCLFGYKNHKLVHSSESLGSIFQGALPNRVTCDVYDLHKSKIGAVLSLHEEWELQPCMFSVPYKEKQWTVLGMAYKNIIPKDNTLSDEDLQAALIFIQECALKKLPVYIHGNATASNKILSKYLENKTISVASFISPRETLVVDSVDLADMVIEKIVNDNSGSVTPKVNNTENKTISVGSALFTSPRETLVVDSVDLADTVIGNILNDNSGSVTPKVNNTSQNLTELQRKIEKTTAHIMHLKDQQQKTKSAGAGRQKRASLSEQIIVHQKRLEKLGKLKTHLI